MTAIWMFEGGRLEARNEAGELLRWCRYLSTTYLPISAANKHRSPK